MRRNSAEMTYADTNSSTLADDFRGAMSLTAAGVAVIATQGAGGLAGATVSSFTSLSIDPPATMVGLQARSGTLAALRANGAFGISILAQDQEAAARLFALNHARRDAPFSEVEWRALIDGAPVLSGALAQFGCRLADCFRYRDSVVVVGEVLALDVRQTSPLVYSARTYRSLA